MKRKKIWIFLVQTKLKIKNHERTERSFRVSFCRKTVNGKLHTTQHQTEIQTASVCERESTECYLLIARQMMWCCVPWPRHSPLCIALRVCAARALTPVQYVCVCVCVARATATGVSPRQLYTFTRANVHIHLLKCLSNVYVVRALLTFHDHFPLPPVHR